MAKSRPTALRRPLLVGLAALAHAALLWGLWLAPVPRAPVGDAGAGGGAVVAGLASAEPEVRLPERAARKRVPPDVSPVPEAARPEPVPPDRTPDLPKDAVLAAVLALVGGAAEAAEPFGASSTDTVAAGVAGTGGEACPMATDIQVALAADPAVGAALAAIPRSARSVAGALMLWNGTWQRADAPGAVLAAAVSARVALAPEACRAAVNEGPVFLIVPHGTEVTVLALGSGTWRWGDLVAGEGTSSPVTTATPWMTAVRGFPPR